MKNKILKTVIIDDSAKARKLLSLIIAEHIDYVEIIGQASDVDEALVLIATLTPDFILLDIEMPGKSGIELVEILIDRKIKCDVIFTTAFNDYAIKAFRLSAIDYLLKPINEGELIKAVEKVQKRKLLEESDLRLKTLSQNLKPDSPGFLCIPVLNGYEYFQLKDIEYIEASGSYVNIALLSGKLKTVSKNLKFFENALQSFIQFFRIHRSCLINLEQLKIYSKSGSGTITLQSGKELSIARDRRNDFLKTMENFLRTY
jgi:two-component system, LytTR family, response regulator